MVVLSRFFVKKKDSTYERAKKKRFDMKMKTLKNLICMEETRLANEEKKKTKNTTNPQASTVKTANDVCSDDQPPTAKYVYDIVFERVEEEPIDKAIGIPRDDPLFLRAVILLKERIKVQVEEAKNHTSEAQGLSIITNTKVTSGQQLAADHRDGEKLSKLLEFAKDNFAEKFIKQFGKSVQIPGEIVGVPLKHFDACYLKKRRVPRSWKCWTLRV